MKLTKKHISLLIASMLLFACSGEQETDLPKEAQELKNLTTYSIDEQPDSTISFAEDVIYGDSEEVTIGYMGKPAIDSLGRVYVHDMQQMSVYVFKPNGHFITKIGRKGRGPGEFDIIKNVEIRNNHMHVYDSELQRVTIFNLDPLEVDKIHVVARNRENIDGLDRPHLYPWLYQVYARYDGSYLAEFIADSTRPQKAWEETPTYGMFYKLDNTGEVVSDKLLEITQQTRVQKQYTPPAMLLAPLDDFYGESEIVIANDNSLYWAGPRHFLVKKYSPNGVYQRAFYYPIEKIPITEETAIEADVGETAVENIQSMNLPAAWPVITDMLIDDQDRLWIATTVEDMTIYQWWVMDTDGQLITKFNWPRDKPIQMIKGASIYTKETVEETGLRYIVRYSFEMEKQ